MVKINDIINYLEHSFADITRQSKWDFSGKQIYTGNREVSKVALSLDPKYNIIEKAINSGCEVLITHHPLFFQESKGIDISNQISKKIILAIKNGLDIISYHTNIDIATNGTNDYLCNLLEAEILDGYLSYEGEESLYKLSVFVPDDYKDIVFEALSTHGAGSVYGAYSGCGFMSEGIGRFTPLGNANPFIGEVGRQEQVKEVKIETVVLKKDLKNVIQAMLKAHPYEEVAYDIYKLENKLEYGFGKIAKLKKSYHLDEFISFIKDKLNLDYVITNMKDIPPFDKIGVCSGSGSSLWRDAKNKGINVLLTGDLKYHEALDASENQFCIIDATHQGTEEIYMQYLSSVLKKQFNIETIILKQEQQLLVWGGR